MIEIDSQFSDRLLDSNLPPWRMIPSRMAAHLMGVSIQTLANWRMRDLGPPAEPMLKGGGNRIYYRPDKIWSWQTGKPEWQISLGWLQRKEMAETLTEADTGEYTAWLDDIDMFPHPKKLWRQFRPIA